MLHHFDSRQSYLRLALCLMYATVGGIGQWSPVVLMPNMEAALGLERTASSSLYSITLGGFALGSLLFGKLGDLIGPRKIMLLSAVSMCIGYTLIAFSTTFATLAFVHFLFIGLLGSSTSFALVISEVSLWFQRKRGLAVAVAASGLYLAGVVWSPLLQAMIGPLGWQTTHLIIAAACIVVMPAATFLMGAQRAPVETHESQKIHVQFDAIGVSPQTLQILLSIAGVCCCVAMAMPQVHLVSYCMSLGFGPAAGTEMLAMMLGAGVISRIGFGLVADYLGGTVTLLIGSSLQMLAIGSFLFFDGFVSLYVISVIFGLSQGGIVPSYALIVRQYFPSEQAHWRVSMVATATVVGMAIGGMLPGVMFDWTGGYQIAFLNGIFWNLINIAIIAWLVMKTGKTVRLHN